MTSRLAGHALVECLIEQGVDTAFGVPGESYLAVLDGFHEHATASASSPAARKAARRSWPMRRASSAGGRASAS